MKPELIADYKCEVGENPLWHPMEKRVYWVDIPRGRIYYYDPARKEHGLHFEGGAVGGFTIQADGSLLLFMDKGAVAMLRGGKLTRIIESIPGEENHRFNDVIADPQGRVFGGTIAMTLDKPGRLYRIDRDKKVTKLLDGIGISNGFGFTLDHKRMYYTDSKAGKIYIFDYDEKTGDIGNQQVFVQAPHGKGLPDGMTVDSQGFVWSARWDDWALYRYSPMGIEERRIEFPAMQVSSAIFGGDDLTDIYVTTAGGQDKLKHGPGAGALFRINVGIKGMPEFHSRIGM